MHYNIIVNGKCTMNDDRPPPPVTGRGCGCGLRFAVVVSAAPAPVLESPARERLSSWCRAWRTVARTTSAPG